MEDKRKKEKISSNVTGQSNYHFVKIEPMDVESGNYSGLGNPLRKITSSKNSEDCSSLGLLERKLDIALGKISSLQTQINDMLERQCDIGSQSQSSCDIITNFDILQSFLPLRTVEQLREFEETLETSPNVLQDFKKIICKVGGKSIKEHVRRVLEKIFANELAMKCSLQGKKGNIALQHSACITVPRDTLITIYESLTERTYNTITADWLCFAKQRLERSLKKQRQIQQP